ncbi:MAG: hypothetical protein FWG53_08030 [Clostridiales bacterium]|nr:hypothetical protein [Clostridiales bacterium]
MGSKEYGDEAAIYEIANAEPGNHNEEDSMLIVERCIIEGKLYMAIPEGFALMPPEIAELKYPSENRPDITYSDEEGTTTVNFTLTKDKLANDGIEAAMEYLQRVVAKMHPSSETISSGVIEGELRIGHFDFISPAIDGGIYNLVFVFPLDGQFMLGTFNCMHLDMAAWLAPASQMVSSIRIAKG